MSTQDKLADALDCFWNAAIGPARDSGDFSTIQTVGAIAEGFAAVSQRLREHSEAHDAENGKADDWTCANCTKINPMFDPWCSACEEPRPAHPPAPEPQGVVGVVLRARELLAAEYKRTGDKGFADAIVMGDFDNEQEIHAIIAALQQPQTAPNDTRVTDEAVNAALMAYYRSPEVDPTDIESMHEAITAALPHLAAQPARVTDAKVAAFDVFQISGGDVERNPNPTGGDAIECLRNLRQSYDDLLSPLPAEPVAVDKLHDYPATHPMTPGRAIYFLERFKRDEKMLGPNEQLALDFSIAALRQQPVTLQQPAAAIAEFADAQKPFDADIARIVQDGMNSGELFEPAAAVPDMAGVDVERWAMSCATDGLQYRMGMQKDEHGEWVKWQDVAQAIAALRQQKDTSHE